MATKELADSLPTRALASALARSPARRIGLPGQAFMEMALGMLALALVLASLFGFTSYILSSLEMQRDLRADAGRGALEAGGGDESYSSKTAHDVVEVEQFAADYVFGSSEVEVQEEVHIPAMAGLYQWRSACFQQKS